MAVEKEKLTQLLRLFGYKANASAITRDDEEEIEPGAMADDYEEEEEPMPKRPVKKNRAVQPAAIPSAQSSADFQNLLMLNQLIDDVGGFDAYKQLLLNAVDAVEVMQQNQSQERESLVMAIVANSAGSLEDADLEDVPMPTLRKMAGAYAPMPIGADFRMLASRGVKQNRADDVAEPPSFFLAQNKKED